MIDNLIFIAKSFFDLLDSLTIEIYQYTFTLFDCLIGSFFVAILLFIFFRLFYD